MGIGGVTSDSDPVALAHLHHSHREALRRYFAGRVGSAAADDLVSLTFVAALRRWPAFDPAAGTPAGWLFGIATNVLRDHRRAERRHLAAMTKVAAQQILDSDADADPAIARVDAARALARLLPDLRRLSPVDRDILLLSAWAGLSLAEIAHALNMPPATVRSRLFRVRQRLLAADRRSQAAAADDGPAAPAASQLCPEL